MLGNNDQDQLEVGSHTPSRGSTICHENNLVVLLWAQTSTDKRKTILSFSFVHQKDVLITVLYSIMTAVIDKWTLKGFLIMVHI